jgi:hypothetical protein
MKVRANLAATHIGPETLEEAVQDYVNRNTDLYDLPGMVAVSFFFFFFINIFCTETTVCRLTCCPTLTHYPDSEPTRLCSFSLMLRA